MFGVLFFGVFLCCFFQLYFFSLMQQKQQQQKHEKQKDATKILISAFIIKYKLIYERLSFFLPYISNY